MQTGGVVSDGVEETDDLLVSGVGEGLGPGHDPDVSAAGDADDGGFVGVIDLEDQVGGLEGPKELHAPFGLGDGVVDESGRVIDLEGAVWGAAMEPEGGGDRAVGLEFVAFDGVVGI